ncbi:unnamed protein product [Acanthoscelides obtectus]|uniref:Uncharacterized protein n=1 Tax=Acanthoscelides obtectus TaxID=200917 RepID=A0A9P0P7P1_ACAOB|nr:unnamed protein product [Acanthoscelides obtectus]CAK1629325.1 hypothetical protein AOBTE_LOCUS5682 [Acanthoscelides obtectus]
MYFKLISLCICCYFVQIACSQQDGELISVVTPKSLNSQYVSIFRIAKNTERRKNMHGLSIFDCSAK